MPRFSILTIAMNAEDHLKEALQSVLDQNFSDYEHILWDGGSTDGTLEIAQKFPHVLVRQGQDLGIGDAMNKAASLASGDFLLFLHADDRLASTDVLGVVNSSLEKYPECLWLYGQVEVINSRGKKIKSPQFVPFSHKRLRKYNCIAHPATFIEKKLFESAGGFATDLRYCMDYDLWLRLAEKTAPLALPFVVSSFREHANSLSTSEPLYVTDEAYLVRNRYLKWPWERYRSYRTWKRRRKELIDL